jgi:glycosyltransferase involved in cell wall biosynthesis
LQQLTRVNIIVPCYNPPLDWETALAARMEQLNTLMPENAAPFGLIVVNDGSKTNVSAANFQQLATLIPTVKVISYDQNRGKGYALREGVKASSADFHVVTDMDFPYTNDSMVQIVSTLRAQGGIVVGNRDVDYYERVPFFRRKLSQFFRLVLRYVLRQPIDDSQCGLKGFDHAGRDLFLSTTIDRFLFDLEFLMLAKNKVKVTPVKVTLRDGVVFSKVGLKTLWIEGLNFLQILMK